MPLNYSKGKEAFSQNVKTEMAHGNSKFVNNNTLSPQKRLIQRRYDAKRKYGLTLIEADSLRTGTCEICNKKARKMCIDHKVPGSYRGVLCQQCNVRLGWLESYNPVIMDYVQRGLN